MFCLLTLQIMLFSDMFLIIPLITSPIITMGTDIWLFSSVYSVVSYKTALLCKLVVTEVAGDQLGLWAWSGMGWIDIHSMGTGVKHPRWSSLIQG